MGRFYLKSFGCKVAQYDGQGLREQFIRAGWVEIPVPEGADLLAVNFCVVTGRSASRCLRILKSLVRRQPSARVVVSGCLGAEEKAKVCAACPEAIVLDSENARNRLDELLPHDPAGETWPGGVQGLEGRARAFIKVQDGCNLKCTYCIIPSIRGRERSRPVDDIINEARRLIDAGFRELVICGIRLGGYRHENLRLHGLIEEVLRRIPGVFRLRLSSLNPAEVTPALLEIMAHDPRVAKHLHLPLQSGDREILKRMKRPYSPARFLSKVDEIRGTLSNPALSTDLMVGFPGENDAAFQASLDLIEKAGVSRVHVFPYSLRRNTVAAGLEQVPDGVKTERVRLAQEMAGRLKESYDRACLGSVAKVLIEEMEGRGNGLPEGLTSRYQKAVVPGLDPARGAGIFVRVKLKDYKAGLFTGSVCSETHHERQ
ncbi:MAG: MiaB/RimO family radical SAM methylthiotransferase [Planctomycetota bacterium]